MIPCIKVSTVSKQEKIMRLASRFAIMSVFCGMLLMSSAVLGQNTSIVFPDVEGWEKGDKATYPSAELGYSIPYQSETAGSVTVYIYNAGLKAIADGITDKTVKSQRTQAEGDIKAYGDQGYYQDVKLIKSDTVTLGGSRTALYSLFSMKVRGTEMDSEIYLFGYKNNFVKIRATRPKGKNGASNAEVTKLLSALAKAFA